MTLKKQLILALTAVGLVPFMVMGITSYINGSSAVSNEAYAKLKIARDLKKGQLEQYLQSVTGAMDALGHSGDTVRLFNELVRMHKEQGVLPTENYHRVTERSEYGQVVGEYEDYWKLYLKKFNLSDVYMICKPHGHVMYSVQKAKDFGTNIGMGKTSTTALTELWQKVSASQKTEFIDMAPYAPKGGSPEMFIGTPIMSKGVMIGIVGVQLDRKVVNAIMQERTGMGETGETYLVGSDSLMRSDSYLDPKNHTVAASFANSAKGSVKTEAVKEALSGKTDAKILTDYNGNPVLSAFTKVNVFGSQWALMAEMDESEVFAPINNLRNVTIILGGVFLLIIVGGALLLGNLVSRPIIASVESISEANGQVVSASDQIAASATSLAEGASSQASSVEEVSATIEQSTAINTQNAENAKEADILAKDATEAASKGNDKVRNLITSMDQISSSSEQISKIIKTIDEIAFQTNLLALNAAVEAARAGEHGLGFAVVADEVKNLASRSAQAAKETEGIIQASIEQVKSGNLIAQETNAAFAEILDKVKKTSDLISEIAISAKEQSEGMSQISQAMSTIDEVTQRNAASSEEAAAAAEELNAQANAMLESVADVGRMVGVVVALNHQNAAMKKVQSAARSSMPSKPVKKLPAKPMAAKPTVGKPTAPQPKPAPAKPAPKIIIDDEDFKPVSTKPAASKPSVSKPAPKPKSSNEDVFPLDDDDLKEF